MSDRIKELLDAEITQLKESLSSQITDPAEKEAIVRMTNDLAKLPIRMLQGEDVSLLLASLKAEAALRGVSFALKSQAAVQQAWMNIITKVVTAAIVGVIA